VTFRWLNIAAGRLSLQNQNACQGGRRYVRLPALTGVSIRSSEMNRSPLTTTLAVLLFLCCSPVIGSAAIDDGMRIDEPISDSVELDRNISYIFASVAGQGRTETSSNLTGATLDEDLALGSIIIAPGADVGDVTLVFEGDNNTLIHR